MGHQTEPARHAPRDDVYSDRAIRGDATLIDGHVAGAHTWKTSTRRSTRSASLRDPLTAAIIPSCSLYCGVE